MVRLVYYLLAKVDELSVSPGRRVMNGDDNGSRPMKRSKGYINGITTAQYGMSSREMRSSRIWSGRKQNHPGSRRRKAERWSLGCGLSQRGTGGRAGERRHDVMNLRAASCIAHHSSSVEVREFVSLGDFRPQRH